VCLAQTANSSKSGKTFVSNSSQLISFSKHPNPEYQIKTRNENHIESGVIIIYVNPSGDDATRNHRIALSPGIKVSRKVLVDILQTSVSTIRKRTSPKYAGYLPSALTLLSLRLAPKLSGRRTRY